MVVRIGGVPTQSGASWPSATASRVSSSVVRRSRQRALVRPPQSAPLRHGSCTGEPQRQQPTWMLALSGILFALRGVLHPGTHQFCRRSTRRRNDGVRRRAAARTRDGVTLQPTPSTPPRCDTSSGGGNGRGCDAPKTAAAARPPVPGARSPASFRTTDTDPLIEQMRIARAKIDAKLYDQGLCGPETGAVAESDEHQRARRRSCSSPTPTTTRAVLTMRWRRTSS